MKKILIVFDTFYPFTKGGGQHRVYQIAKKMAFSGYSVDWIGIKMWTGSDVVFIDGINCIGLHMHVDIRKNSSRRSVFSAIRFSYQLFLQLKRNHNYDIVFTPQTPWLHLFVLFYFFRLKKPIVLDVWEVWQEHWEEYYGKFVGGFGKILERFFLKKVDMVVAISEMTRNKILEIGISEKKIELIHNGVELDLVNNINPSSKIYDLVYFGRLVPHKNVDYFIKALALIVQKGMQINAIIMGGGQELDRLKNLSNELSLSDILEFTGDVQDISSAFAVMKSSKLFILPSTSEGGGSIALLEANACGLPVLAVKHSQGIDPNLIQDGQNGIWIDVLDESLMANKIENFLTNSILQAKMKKDSQIFAASFDWNELMDNYIKLIERLTSGRDSI